MTTLLWPPGAVEPVTAGSCCKECAHGLNLLTGPVYGWHNWARCSANHGGGGTTFWTPQFTPPPGQHTTYEYFKPHCDFFNAPYADNTGTRDALGNPIDPAAPADQSQFWGQTNAQAALSKMAFFANWSFPRVPVLHGSRTEQLILVASTAIGSNAEDLWLIVDGYNPGMGVTVFTLPADGSGMIGVPNHGSWRIVSAVRQYDDGFLGDMLWTWDEWYVNIWGVLEPGGDGTGGRWAGVDDQPVTSAAWACLPGIKQLQTRLVEGISVYGG